MKDRPEGNPKTFHLKITKELIASAKPNQANQCILAQAVRLAGCSSVAVTSEYITFNHEGRRYAYPTPVKASRMIVRFDDHKVVRPMNITLDGRSALVKPVMVRGKSKKPILSKKKKVKVAAKKVAKKCVRRHRGIRVIEVRKTA